jgi:hypothetical protein
MPELLWASERPVGHAQDRFELYRIADGSLHLAVAEAYGANLTDADIIELGEVLLPDIRRIAGADRPAAPA